MGNKWRKPRTIRCEGCGRAVAVRIPFTNTFLIWSKSRKGFIYVSDELLKKGLIDLRGKEAKGMGEIEDLNKDDEAVMFS